MIMNHKNQQDHENIEPQKFGATRLPAGCELHITLDFYTCSFGRPIWAVIHSIMTLHGHLLTRLM